MRDIIEAFGDLDDGIQGALVLTMCLVALLIAACVMAVAGVK